MVPLLLPQNNYFVKSHINKRMRIYVITNLINNKRYVGMTSKPLEVRFNGHLADARRNKPWRLHKAIRKYGENNFKIELLEETSARDLNELGIIETSYIEKLKPEYNMSLGGEGNRGADTSGEKNGMFNRKHTMESRAKMSANRKGKGARPGELNPRFGKPGTFAGCQHTDETKQKMRKPKSVPRQRVICEICSKDVSINTIGQHKRRYHEFIAHEK
jgi:group I intron endonuclease